MHMEVRVHFGRFVCRGVNIDDVTIHLSRGSSINPTLKVCEHNWAADASIRLITLHKVNRITQGITFVVNVAAQKYRSRVQ